MALLTPPPTAEKNYPPVPLPFYEDIFGQINVDETPAAEADRCETESDSDDNDTRTARPPGNVGFFKKYAVPEHKKANTRHSSEIQSGDRAHRVAEVSQYRIDPSINKKHSVPATPTKLSTKKFGLFSRQQAQNTTNTSRTTPAHDDLMMSGGLGEHNGTTTYDGLRAGSNNGDVSLDDLGDLNDSFQTLEDDGDGPRAGGSNQTVKPGTVLDAARNIDPEATDEDKGHHADRDERPSETVDLMPKKRGRPRPHPILDAGMAAMGRTRSSDKRKKQAQVHLIRRTRSSAVAQPVVQSKRNKSTARGATRDKKAKRKTVSFGDLTASAPVQGGSKKAKLVRGRRPGGQVEEGGRLSPVVVIPADKVVDLEEYEKHY